jgi:hypothetical protein
MYREPITLDLPENLIEFPQMAEDHLAWLKGTPSPIEEDADNTLVIIVNGPAQSGKDTLSETVRGHFYDVVDLPRENAWAYNLSTVDHIKEIAAESFGWDGMKDEKGRTLLWSLKNVMTDYNDGVFKGITDRIDRISKRTPEDLHLFVIHSREPDEIERFQVKYPCSYSVYINRPAVLKESPPTQSDDPDIIENYPYDFYLDNETTLEAFEASCQFMIEHILTVEGRCKPV